MAAGQQDITHIGQLTPDARNARKHNPRNIGMIADALQEVGAARSIVIDEHGNILAGNGTIDAAAQAGIERLRVIDTDGDEIIAVRRSGLSAKQKKRLALFDNRTAETAEWDVDVLAEFSSDKLLEGMFYTDELDAILATLDKPTGGGGDEFDTTPADGPTRCQPGDLWQLGEHRLLCGDSTKVEDVARLMGGEGVQVIVTDPPYGINYNRHLPDPKHKNIQNDTAPDPTGLLALLPSAEAMYVWSRWDVLHTWVDAMPLPVRNVIVWDKQSNGMGDLTTTYAPSWEACIFASQSGHKLRGGRERDVWAATRPSTEDHLTPKPVGLLARCIEKSSDRGNTVWDGFLGSGTTLIAAERTGRKCYGMEIEPKYCDVILRRWEAETGKVAAQSNG